MGIFPSKNHPRRLDGGEQNPGGSTASATLDVLRLSLGLGQIKHRKESSTCGIPRRVIPAHPICGVLAKQENPEQPIKGETLGNQGLLSCWLNTWNNPRRRTKHFCSVNPVFLTSPPRQPSGICVDIKGARNPEYFLWSKED
ncbi:unnamed protein product [Caretta caretta]